MIHAQGTKQQQCGLTFELTEGRVAVCLAEHILDHRRGMGKGRRPRYLCNGLAIGDRGNRIREG